LPFPSPHNTPYPCSCSPNQHPRTISRMSLPTLSNLIAIIESLQHSVLSFEDRLSHMESTDHAHIVTVSMTPTSPPSTSTSTHGKGKAKAAPAPMKAKLAKWDCPTKKPTMPSDALPLHLTQTFPQEGKPDHHLITMAIPDVTAAHAIRRGGKGLKQIHDISSARVSVHTLMSGLCNECHISIQGTDEQIGDALVVLGKQIAWKCICAPTVKKTVPDRGPKGTSDSIPPPVACWPSPINPVRATAGWRIQGRK
jgi:hypothetical protein